jgi:hypothetical protein
MRKAKEERMAERAREGKTDPAPPTYADKILGEDEPKTYEVVNAEEEAPPLEEVDIEAERASAAADDNQKKQWTERVS